MSHSIRSPTKKGEDLRWLSRKGRKINVDLVLDRKSVFLYFGIMKGRHCAGLIYDHLKKGNIMRLARAIGAADNLINTAAKMEGQGRHDEAMESMLSLRELMNQPIAPSGDDAAKTETNTNETMAGIE